MRSLVTNLLHDLIRAYAARPPFDAYIDAEDLLVVATRGRRGMSGKHAACHFTAFAENSERISPDGHWEFPELVVDGRPIRYVISFVLPRFLFLEPEQQAEDVVHELLHIAPSFCGSSSALRHGRRYNALTRQIARAGLADGVTVPSLGRDGDTIYYRKLKRFPDPVRRRGPEPPPIIDETALVVSTLTVNAEDRQPPPPRYLYECPSCGQRYARRRALRMASCGACARGYDGRFKLRLIWSEARKGRSGLSQDPPPGESKKRG